MRTILGRVEILLQVPLVGLRTASRLDNVTEEAVRGAALGGAVVSDPLGAALGDAVGAVVLGAVGAAGAKRWRAKLVASAEAARPRIRNAACRCCII